MTCGHEQSVAPGAAEAHVGATLGQSHEPNRLTGGIEDLDSILLRIAHPPAAPQIPVDITAESVRRPTQLGRDEGPAIRKLVAVDIEDADHARGNAGLHDVELALVGREGKPVRPIY